MKRFNKIFFVLICLVIFFSTSAKAMAAKDCECYSDLDKLGASQVYKNSKNILKATCIEATTDACGDKVKVLGKGKIEPVCIHVNPGDAGITSETRCQNLVQEWQVQFDSMLAEGKNNVNSSAKEVSAGSSALSTLIQKCGEKVMDPACWDVTVFVSLLLELTNYLFGIIGALALGAFVYGGFVLILSQGNPEKVKQGTGAMINAVIGLLIAFGGYVIVSYLGEILKLKSEFGLLK